MARRFTFIFVILCFIGALAYSYFYFKEKKHPVSNAIHAIPTSAAVIIETKSAIPTWKKLSETNIIWSEFDTTNYINTISSSIAYLDSIRKLDIRLNSFLEKQSVFISSHMTGATRFDYLFTLALPSTVGENDLHQFIETHLSSSSPITKNYDGKTIYSVKSGKSNSFNYAYLDGILTGSFSMILVEEAIRQYKLGNSLLTNIDFQKVMHTAGEKIDANIYINYQVVPNILGTLLKPEFAKHLTSSLSDIASWTEVDASFKPNSVGLNGYTYSNDSSSNFLNVFKNQQPTDFEMQEILPAKTATIIRTGLSDIKAFENDYKTYLEKNNLLFDYGINLKEFDVAYGVSLKDQFLYQIGNEFACVITTPKSEDLTENYFAVFHVNNKDLMVQNMNTLDSLINIKKELNTDTITYDGYKIQHLQCGSFLKKMFGKPYHNITENYFTFFNDYLVFGNSITGLKEFINANNREKTLEKDIYFSSYSDNLQDESTIFVYSNIAKSFPIYKTFCGQELTQDLNVNESLFKKFEAVSFQISKDKHSLYFNNLYLNYNPITKKETTSLWETQLDTSISREPWLVTNHYSGFKEIFVQDDNNDVYLISNTGKVLWKKEFSKPILGSVTQIDAFKNNKLQLLFNTDTAVYLLDRNGNMVENFPVHFESKITAPLAALDYDNSKSYRIIIPTLDKKIHNLDQLGKAVKGWEAKNSKAIISNPFTHMLMNGKDYIISTDKEGNIYALSRKGTERLNLSTKLKSEKLSFQNGKSLDKAFILGFDSTSIKKVFLNDDLDSTGIESINNFYFEDLDNDNSNDYILQKEETIEVVRQDLEPIFTYELENPIAHISTYSYGETSKCGFSYVGENEFYVLNGQGELLDGFPLYGSTPFRINDINKDGKLELIIGSKDGNIYSYTLE